MERRMSKLENARLHQGYGAASQMKLICPFSRTDPFTSCCAHSKVSDLQNPVGGFPNQPKVIALAALKMIKGM